MRSEEQHLEGGCFCGAVRYVASADPTHETLCHCSMCRRVSGAPMVAWFTVPTAKLAFVRGTPATLRSSQHATRTFCATCGTPLTFQSNQTPEEIDVTTCSLDRPELVPPKDQTRTSARLAWVRLDDHMPAYPETREG